MRISAKVDYAVRAVVELAGASDDRPVTAEQIASAQAIPMKFLQNILAELRHAGVVESRRGAAGGHYLARPPEAITVADVIRAIDGPLGAVGGRAPEAIEYPGPAARIQDTWVAVRASVRSVLEKVTIADITEDTLPEEVTRLLAQEGAWTRR